MEHAAELIACARRAGASDIHLGEELPAMMRVCGALTPVPCRLNSEAARQMILELLSPEQTRAVEAGRDVDTAFSLPDGGRQRVNVYHQQGRLAATIRLLNDAVPTLQSLGLPPVLEKLADLPRGLVLVTGPTGSGKSTTLAAMVGHVNETRPVHILTIEDPIEYVYTPRQALIHQREIGRDAESFSSALRSALREDPDILLVGEMRDRETIAAALTAAETGHLVLSTLHTTGAARTIDRIVDAFPAESQSQVRIQLAGVLRGVVTQCLIPTMDGEGRTAATEILVTTDAVANLIRENKCHQIGGVMQAGGALGMHTLNADLARLVQEHRITRAAACQYTSDARDLQQFLS